MLLRGLGPCRKTNDLAKALAGLLRAGKSHSDLYREKKNYQYISSSICFASDTVPVLPQYGHLCGIPLLPFG